MEESIETQVVGDRVQEANLERKGDNLTDGDYTSSDLQLSGGSCNSFNEPVVNFATIGIKSLRLGGLAAAATAAAAARSIDLQHSGGSCNSVNEPVVNFATIGIKSLRLGGLAAAATAAARSIALKATEVGPKSLFRASEGSQDSVGDGKPGTKTTKKIVLETPNCRSNVAVIGTKIGEIFKEIETEESQESMQDSHRDKRKSKMHNPTVRKLLYEQISPVDDETTIKPNSVTGKLDSHCSLAPKDFVAGLSDVRSQEPGNLSQADAFDVVDKFVSVNDLGLSQGTDTGKSDMVKSPPILGAKIVQSLAKKIDHISLVVKAGEIFEWNDSQEDEGGGEFFTKRKESLFELEVATQSRSEPPKSNNVRCSFGLDTEVVHKSGKKRFNTQDRKKRSTFTCSDSRVMMQSSFRNEKVHVSNTKTKKDIFKDLSEQSNLLNLEKRLEVTDLGKDGDIYEALVHESPLNYEKTDNHAVAENLAKTVCEGAAMKIISSQRTLVRDSTFSTPNSEGVSTRSKSRRILPTISRTGSPSFSRSNLLKGNSLDCTTEKMKDMKGQRKAERNLNDSSSVDKAESSVYLKGRKATSPLNGTTNKEVDNCHNSLSLNVQLSPSEEHIFRELHVSSTPTAHLTRCSKAIKLSTHNESLANERDASGLIGVRTRGAMAREDKLAAEASGTLKMKRKGYNIESDQNAVVEAIEKPKARSLVKDTSTDPKRRRTSRIASDNPYINDDMNNSSVSVDKIQLGTLHGQIKTTIRSVSKKLTPTSIVTRSSLKSLSKANPNECVANPVLYKAGSANAANPCSTSLNEGGDSISLNENGGDKFKSEGSSPKADPQPSSQTCTPLKDVNVLSPVSPVCVAQDFPGSFDNKGRCRSSIDRELTRLEAPEASPTRIFNTQCGKDMASVRVLFSHLLDNDIIKQQKKIVRQLGVALASSISDATHFVTDKFVPTRNMLEAMSMGKPVVTHMWLESCGQTGCFVDEKHYILRDAMEEIGFSMPVSLDRASQSQLLQGKRVYVTPNTKPDWELLSSLVKASHGQPIERIGRSALKADKLPDDLLVLSCEEDFPLCVPLLEKGAEIFSSELLLNGVVNQKLEYGRHRLFSDHVRRTRSTIYLRQKDGNRFLPVTRCA